MQLVLALPTQFHCHSGPGDETPLRPRSHLRGGDLLYLAVNGSASLFSCLSFPHSTCQGIFLASYCPASHRAFYGKGSFLSFCNVYSRIINPENVFLLLGFLKIAFLTPFFFFFINLDLFSIHLIHNLLTFSNFQNCLAAACSCRKLLRT